MPVTDAQHFITVYGILVAQRWRVVIVETLWRHLLQMVTSPYNKAHVAHDYQY